MKKRLLSVALILSILASLLMVGITGPVSAVKDTYVTKEAYYDRAIDLSKELTPSVNLTFDGKAPYGIPYGRFSSAQNTKYQNDSLWLQGPGGNGFWVFFGEDGTVGETIVSYMGGTSVTNAHAEAVAKLYTFNSGKTYTVSFDMKAAINSTVATNNTIIFGTSPDPSNASLSANQNADRMTVISQSGFTLEYKVDGEVQTSGTLAKDSDWQTATVTFTANKDVKFGICTKLSGTNIYVDNVKIYDLTEYGKSTTTQNKITFDEFTGGWALSRYSKWDTIAEENGNRYGVIQSGANGYSTFFASTEYSSRYTVVPNEYKSADGRANIDKAYSTMFKFESNKSYEVSFKYRYAEGQSVEVGTTKLRLKVSADPAGAAHIADDFSEADNATCWVKDVYTSGLTLENAPSTEKWQTAKIVFTVKADSEINYNTYGYIRPGEGDLQLKDTGVYFGIRGDDKIIHVDDYQVKELVNYRLINLQVDNVCHDMEGYEVGTTPSDLMMHNNGAASVVASGDSKYGKILQFTGNRGTFTDSNIFVSGKKYYISFDAKTIGGHTTFMWLIFANAVNNNSSGSTPRYILSDGSGNSTSTPTGFDKMFKFYIDGQQVTKSNFKITGQWQHFGLVVDFTNEEYNANLEAGSSESANLFDTAKNFYCGMNNTYYDNIRIIAVNTMNDAVPTSDISYVSKEIYHDMETYGGFNEVEEGTAHIVNSYDKKYGQVMEITKGTKARTRIAFTDSNIITKDKKYYISFDAKTTNDTNRYMWLMISTTETTNWPRFIISDITHEEEPANLNEPENCKGATDYTIAENGNAFKYYIDGQEVHRDNFKLSGGWRKYTLVIDTSDPDLIAKSNATSGQIKTLLSGTPKYFYFGAENAWFDNFRMVEVSETAQTVSKEKGVYDTEVSYREESTSVDGEYISAGLRFKGKLPNGIAVEADEIGFVAAPSSLARITADWYKLENKANSIARKVIVKDDTRNYVYATEGDDTYYQLVFTDLSTEDGRTAYNRRFSAVMYVKVNDKYNYYPLGEKSYNQVVGISNVLNFDQKTLDVKTMAKQGYKVVYDTESCNTWVVKNQIIKLCDALDKKEFSLERIQEEGVNKGLPISLATASDYEIIIGNTSRGIVGDDSALRNDNINNKNNYAIRISGSKVYVMAGSTYALQAAIYELETMVESEESKITEKEGSYLDTAVIDSTSEYKLVWQSEFDDPKTVTYNSSDLASIKNWWVDSLEVNSTSANVKGSQAFLVSDRETVQWDEQGYLILRATKVDNPKSTIKYEKRADWSGNSNLKYKQQGGIHCSEMEFNCGYVEMRAKIPDGKGIYSSFWLNGKYNGKTPQIEIDIFESLGSQSTLNTNIHWWNLPDVINTCSDANKTLFATLNNNIGTEGRIHYGNGAKLGSELYFGLSLRGLGRYNKFYPHTDNITRTYKLEGTNALYNWHTIGLLWTDEVLEFYCDGVLYHSRDIKDFIYPDGQTHAFYDQFENIIGGFNLGWNERYEKGQIDESTMTWDEDGYLNYVIDYFRLYQIDENWKHCTDYN